MYLTSAVFTTFCLIAFASAEALMHFDVAGDPMAWSALVSGSALVFAVQTGVQTFPTMYSGVLFSNDMRALGKGTTRAVGAVFLVVTLKVCGKAYCFRLNSFPTNYVGFF